MDKVRLLELRNTYKWGGGPDKTILLSAERHNRKRVETVVAYVRDASDDEFRIGDKARQKGLTYYEIEERGKLDFHVLDELSEIIRRHDINLIHAHDYKSDFFAYVLRWKLKERHLAVMSTMHGWAILGFRGYIYWLLDLFVMRRFDRVIAVSEATKTEMVSAGVPAELISVLYNGIDTDAWSRNQARTNARDVLGVGDAFPLIGYVGRLSVEKDLASWLAVAALVSRQFPEARFVLVGEGKDGQILNQLLARARELGIAERVFFTGYREDLQSIYASFDLFLLSSRREGLCNSLLEAMAMGVPIVATDAGGTKELMVDGKTGYLCAVGDVPAMANAVIKILHDEKLRELIGKTARQHIEERFSFNARMGFIETLYEKVLKTTSSRNASSLLPIVSD